MGRKFSKSFYTWCIENDCIEALDRWDYELNAKTPHEVGTSAQASFYFKCPRGIHDSEKHQLQAITRHGKMIECRACGSFGQWCLDNNHKDFLKRWDYDLNDLSPFEVSASSTKKQYFKCPRGLHDSELKDLNNMRKQYKSGICKQCDSIGQWGIDNISKDFVEEYWSRKNQNDPFSVPSRSLRKIWIKCTNTDYHDDYDVSSANFRKGERCPYCSSKRVHIKDSLGSAYPHSLKVWSDINKDTPYDYLPQSNKTRWFKCPSGLHDDYKRSVCNATKAEFRCPKCTNLRKQSLLQEKVSTYIESLFDDIRHEYECTIVPVNPTTNRPLPFDNEVVELKLIIEVHGQQHYKPGAIFNNNDYSLFEKRKLYDKYKKNFAISNGYHVLEIPYWANDKNDTWKYIIDSQIELLR